MKLNAKKKGVDSIGKTAASTKHKAKETLKNDLLFSKIGKSSKKLRVKTIHRSKLRYVFSLHL